MKSIAITGSFASGKTFVLKYLEKAGYKTFSCDDYVRELYSEPNIRKDILCLFDEKLFDAHSTHGGGNDAIGVVLSS